MSSQAKLKKIYLAVLIIIVLIIGFAANTEQARNLGIDIFFNTAAYITAILGTLYLFKIDQANPENRKWQILRMISIGLNIYLAIITIFMGWPRMPWVKAEAFNTANQFMTELKSDDVQAASAYLTVGEECASLKALFDPRVQPVSWVFSPEPNRVSQVNHSDSLHIDYFLSINGIVTFSGGEKTNLLLQMRWQDNRWKLDGIRFEAYPDLDLDSLASRCAQK